MRVEVRGVETGQQVASVGVCRRGVLSSDQGPGSLGAGAADFVWLKPDTMDRIVREAIKIGPHPNNMDMEAGFCLSKSWKPLINSLKKLSGNDTIHIHWASWSYTIASSCSEATDACSLDNSSL
jgi:hypothetical protein